MIEKKAFDEKFILDLKMIYTKNRNFRYIAEVYKSEIMWIMQTIIYS